MGDESTKTVGYLHTSRTMTISNIRAEAHILYHQGYKINITSYKDLNWLDQILSDEIVRINKMQVNPDEIATVHLHADEHNHGCRITSRVTVYSNINGIFRHIYNELVVVNKATGFRYVLDLPAAIPVGYFQEHDMGDTVTLLLPARGVSIVDMDMKPQSIHDAIYVEVEMILHKAKEG